MQRAVPACLFSFSSAVPSPMPLETNAPESVDAPAEKKKRKKSDASPWELTCLCGHKLAGARKEAAQTVACEHCDREHFILPINRYPAPKSRRKKRKKRDEPLSVTAQRKLKAAGVSSLGLLRLIGNRAKQQLIRVAQSIRNWATPLRMAVIALGVILLGAGLFAFNQHRQESALTSLRQAVSAGETALQEEDWAAATAAYAEANRAVQILQRDDEFARDIQQKDRELQVLANLCTLSLEDIIDEASGKRRLSGNWQNTFQTLVQGRWLVMEGWLTTAATEQGVIVQLAQVLPVSGETVDFRWPERLLENLPASSGQGVHVVCAGRIESLERPTRHEAPWIVHIQPDSAFLWQSPETCAAVGFELDSSWMPQHSLRVVLKQQRAAAGREELD